MPLEGLYRHQKNCRLRISFFPEGGDLVNGVSSILAFEALNQHNKPSR